MEPISTREREKEREKSQTFILSSAARHRLGHVTIQLTLPSQQEDPFHSELLVPLFFLFFLYSFKHSHFQSLSLRRITKLSSYWLYTFQERSFKKSVRGKTVTTVWLLSLSGRSGMDEQFKLLRSTKKTCDGKARQRGKLHVYSSKHDMNG